MNAGALKLLSRDDAVALALAELRAAGMAGEVVARRGDSWSADVRLGQLESVESALTGSLWVGAFGDGNRAASSTTTDLSVDAVRATARAAIGLARFADPDQYAGLPPLGECGVATGDLKLDDPAHATLDRERLIADTIAGEKAAFAVDPRITNAHRSGCSAGRNERLYATTDGVRVASSSTSYGFSVVVVAEAGGEKQTGYWGTRNRFRDQLRAPSEIGRIAGEHAVAMFGWKTMASGPLPVVLAPEVACELLGILGSACLGGNIYRNQSWLAGALGTAIASDVVSIVDDPLLPGELGSRTCDGEGVRARRLALVEGGVLRSYLVSSYTARRLAHPWTGHESGTSNLRLVPGAASRDDLLREMKDGFYVTALHGHGVDLAAGRISKGADGFRVIDGKIAHPVQGVTLAGDLRELLRGIRAVGNDPLPESATSSPSLLIDGFTLGGA